MMDDDDNDDDARPAFPAFSLETVSQGVPP